MPNLDFRVVCSTPRCAFCSGDGYYSICSNPEVISQFRLPNGEVMLSGCKCAGCDRECELKDKLHEHTSIAQTARY